MCNMITRFFILIGLSLSCLTGFSQKNVQLFFGSMFYNDTCTVIIENNNYQYDTIMKNEILNTNLVTGMASELNINYNKSNKKTSIIIILNEDVKAKFVFDRLKNKAQILVEHHGPSVLSKLKKDNNNEILNKLQKKKKKENTQTEYLSFFVRRKGRFQFY